MTIVVVGQLPNYVSHLIKLSTIAALCWKIQVVCKVGLMGHSGNCCLCIICRAQGMVGRGENRRISTFRLFSPLGVIQVLRNAFFQRI